MNHTIRWLRISYWLGAILDARAALNLSHTFLASLNVQDFRPEYGTAAALMWGWTALLIWADRKPLERRGVILLTLAPVILLLAVNVVAQQRIDPNSADYTLILPVAVAVLIFGYSYWQAVKLEQA